MTHPTRTVFTPSDLSALARAFDAALSAVGEGRFDHVPPRALRRTVASSIMAEATRGERDPDRLRDAALAALDEAAERSGS